MSTHTAKLNHTHPVMPPQAYDDAQERICGLLRLQKATQHISSILELDTLLDHVVNGVVQNFGSVEAAIFLKDPNRDELVMASVHGCRIHTKGTRMKFGTNGSVGLVGHTATNGRRTYVPDVSFDPRYIACEPNVQSELDVPLLLNGRLLGVLCIGHPEIDGFSSDSIEMIQVLSDHLSVAIENAQRFREEREINQRMSFEQEEARKIQQALLPRHTPLIPGLKVEAGFVPARAVGGDWYDYIAMDDGRWGFVLADVSGKGLAAAMVMASVRAVVRSVAPSARTPDEVLTRVNQLLVGDFPDGRFVTMLFAIFDPATRILSLANAGHPWPLLSTPESSYFLDTCSGLPLGLMESKYQTTEVIVPRGSRLLMYTDGISEAENALKQEYGFDRMQELMLRPEVDSEWILQEVSRFSGGIASDDATVVMLSNSL